MKFSILLLLIFLSIHNINLAQQMHGVKDPENKYSKKCEKCLSLINNTPREIAYDLYEEDGYVYFYTNNEEWFKLMFKSGKDGIAIEIINKDRYDCNKEKIHKNKLLRGKLVPPLYKKELYKNMIKKDGNIFIKLYIIPACYKDADIEFNLVLISQTLKRL